MENHICPWWCGYVLASPVRRLFQNPERIVAPYVAPDMNVLEVGPGMGFFTLPMARQVGERGKIVCVDVQEKMLASLRRRAVKAGLSQRVETRVCPPTSLGIGDLAGTVDFILAFAVMHELPDAGKAVGEMHRALKPAGTLLISEPKGHVVPSDFAHTVSSACSIGFTVVETPAIKGEISVLLRKK